MRWTSALAIYLLFWVMAAFLVMPFHVRTAHDIGDESNMVPGQAESAPHIFRPKRILAWTTLVGSVFFGLYYANYVQGWITVDMLDFSR